MIAGSYTDRSSRILQIKQDDKFFAKLSSKDQMNSINGEASFRVNYYGGVSGAVPFTWETRPGTPKHTLFEESDSLPPLTPPPSYLFSPNIISNSGKKNPKSKIFQSILPRFTFRESTHARSLSSSSVSSSSLSSSFSAPSTPRDLYISRSRNCTRRSRSVVHFGLDEDEDEMLATSQNSGRCFGGFGSRSSSAGGKLRMYQPVKTMKKTLLSIVGGNGGSTA